MTCYLNIRYLNTVTANPVDSKTKEINRNGFKKEKKKKRNLAKHQIILFLPS